MPAEDPLSPPFEPWRSFLGELDGLLKDPVELRCLGGFVVTQQYGIGRETSDIDFLSISAQSPDDNIDALAGLGSELHRKYRLYMQYVGIATPPADYASRFSRSPKHAHPSSPEIERAPRRSQGDAVTCNVAQEARSWKSLGVRPVLRRNRNSLNQNASVHKHIKGEASKRLQH